MSARAALRSLGWLFSELVPAQAIRTAADRDYSRAVTKAAAVFDAEAGLAEREEAEEVWEPRGQCLGCGNVDTEDHQCGRKIVREPALSADELVAVRQLIEERFPSLNPGSDGERPESSSQDSGRPTSELLTDAAELISYSPYKSWPIVTELRARAAIFLDIET